ncbi:MAG: hypothetical protein JO254_16945 [Pseudolabrys sp.]|nr:hypothetical protein [Pseudolabrys sp.]
MALHRELKDVEHRLDAALVELREQRQLVVREELYDREVMVTLLSNALRQFCWLEDQLNGLKEAIGEELPLPKPDPATAS